MNKELLNSLPYEAIEELIRVRNYIVQITSNNADTITQKKIEDENILCEFIENISGYAFVVRDFKHISLGKNLYTIYRRPESINNIKGATSSGNFDEIKSLFSKWIDDCKKLNAIKREFMFPNGSFYDQEFFDFFCNNDEDAAVRPFELERQEILFYFLLYAENQIQSSDLINDNEKQVLLSEISDLKEDIPKDTKKVFVTRLSKFAQKVKQTSNKLFHDVFDVLKKEIIKKVLYEGASQVPNVISKIEHWIALFATHS